MSSITQSYAESKGQVPFDWNASLTCAIAHPPDAEGWRELERKSERWVTCSVGEQCAILPRESNGAPYDLLLAALGGDKNGGFHAAITAGNAKLAHHILGLVERHSAYLIREELAKRKTLLQRAQGAWDEVKDFALGHGLT